LLLPLLAWLRGERGRQYSLPLARLARTPGLVLLGLVLYAVAFVLGYILVPNASFQRTVVRFRMPFLVLGILLLAVHELALGAFGAATLGSPLGMAFVRLLRGLVTWCLLLAAVGFATRYLARSTRHLPSLNEAYFPLYVLHMPILTILAYFIVRWEAPGIIQFVVLVALTGLVTFTLYKTCIQRLPAMRFLFGLSPSTPPARPSLDLAHAHGGAGRVGEV
jgi:hypothetical protein